MCLTLICTDGGDSNQILPPIKTIDVEENNIDRLGLPIKKSNNML